MNILAQMQNVTLMPSRVRRLAESLKKTASELRPEAIAQGGAVKDAYNSLCIVLDNLKQKLKNEPPEFTDTWNPKL